MIDPHVDADHLIRITVVAELMGLHPKTVYGYLKQALRTGDWSRLPKPCRGPDGRPGNRRRPWQWRRSDVLRFIRTCRIDR